MTHPDRLTIEQIQATINATPKCAGIHIVQQDYLAILNQLLDTMRKALLLAARWFKLNFDDDTLNEHPPSKADLAGMFDAMQEARLEQRNKEPDNA